MVRQRSMRATKEPTGREVAVTLPPKVGARRHFRRHMATSRPAYLGEFAGLGGWAPRSKGCLDVDCRKETPARRCSCDVDADAFGELRPPSTASVHVAEEHRAPPCYAPHEYRCPHPRASSSWFGCPPFGGRPSCRPRRYRTPLAGRAGAPPARYSVPSAGRATVPSFVHPRGRPGGQGAVSARGREASTLRPLSPYGPDKRGLPPFPRFPALRFCCSSGRMGVMCRR